MRAASRRGRGRTLDRRGVGSLDAGTSAFNGGTGLAAGCVLGDRYRLVAELGRGTAGVVWSAVHVVTSAEVALKIVVEPDPSLRVRLLREARVCGGLRHKNVAEVYDLGETAAGQPFLVMQRLHGETLADLLARTPQLPGATAAAIGRDVARALAAAHALGVVHRDLKPENVMVTWFGEGRPWIKVLDFGMARLLQGGPGTPLTRKGAVFGTPEYMPPEQAMGQPVDARADQYAFGVMVFEMIAGTRPFKARSPLEMLQKQIREAPPKLRELAPGTPAGIEAAVERMMAKKPDDRFPDVATAAAALAEAGAGVPRS